MSNQAFFVPDGARFVATELTRGPWSPELQHGGPPSALIGRAVERLEGDFQVARMTVELLRPVPIAPLEVATEVVRAGRTAQVVQASLASEGKLLARATALRIRTTELVLPEVPLPEARTPVFPEKCEPFVFPFFASGVGYHTAMELRFARGTFGQGPCAVWMRMRHPLVAGEEPSPLVRVLVAADSGNGVSLVLDTRRFTFVNPDLTVHLHRYPEGEWVLLDAATTPQANGIGLAESGLHDRRGPIGRSLQSLVVEKRSP